MQIRPVTYGVRTNDTLSKSLNFLMQQIFYFIDFKFAIKVWNVLFHFLNPKLTKQLEFVSKELKLLVFVVSFVTKADTYLEH